MQPQTKPTFYESLEALSEGMTGEILNGQLYTQPRPSGAHATAGFMLGAELLGPFRKGNGGPGGWWIFIEPEVHFVHDKEVTVPDLAGWRRERMSMPPTTEHRFEVTPDWVCEIFPLQPRAEIAGSSCRYTHITVCAIRLADRSDQAHPGGVPTESRRLV